MLSKLWNVGTANHGRTRAVTAENPTGASGAGARGVTGTGAVTARELGTGWKVSPSTVIPAGSTADLAVIAGAGVVRHIWLTTSPVRELVLRMFWDQSTEPAVEVPLGDFFCNGWDDFAVVTSVPITVACTVGSTRTGRCHSRPGPGFRCKT